MEVLMAERTDLVFHNKISFRNGIYITYPGSSDLGFQRATATSISLGIDDLFTIPSKGWLVQDAEQQKKLRQSIEIWYATSEYLRQEIHPNFRMTDPSNPQFTGRTSLTEYRISCYGARKGVVDTAVRTSDAGYLTRRLVEVVQHILVRRTDCGTIRSLSVSQWMTEKIFVLVTIYILVYDALPLERKILGIGLVNRFITFRAHPIYIRTPFTCRSTSWICQLCYGRSPTHGDLVELGEAVGIIAGQSIGEPGTQLTLRTFHTGGVFTGGTAEHVRAPLMEKENLMRIWFIPHVPVMGILLFYSRDILHNVNIPTKSLILVQNDQYVESEQVIAEIRAGTSTFHLKERVQKHISSESEGEMHWSTDGYHAPEYPYSNVHLLPKTSHLWILAGGLCRSNIVYIFDLSLTNDQVRHKVLDTFGKKDREILDYSKPYRIISKGHWNLIEPSTSIQNSPWRKSEERDS
ncbi:hypothetical protein IEQ34_023462 [Dendrobium chrysotoxum]|uniref:DNA-directed RNA polymerase n=1 Tax=Dendrobium chrysotoxum TaxID=161865 RepID=A0AAV7FW46_DENCH|nr:hypothetical protein IEQ34_023462 [Dendrobium chrysotoxum]